MEGGIWMGKNKKAKYRREPGEKAELGGRKKKPRGSA